MPCTYGQLSGGSDGTAQLVVADSGRHVHVRFGVRRQPGAGAALPDHEGLQYRGPDPVVQLADNRVPVTVHVLRGPGHILQVPGLRPHQVLLAAPSPPNNSLLPIAATARWRRAKPRIAGLRELKKSVLLF